MGITRNCDGQLNQAALCLQVWFSGGMHREEKVDFSTELVSSSVKNILKFGNQVVLYIKVLN